MVHDKKLRQMKRAKTANLSEDKRRMGELHLTDKKSFDQMKKISIIILGLMLLFHASCSKNEGEGSSELRVDKRGNLLGTGDSANDILSNTNFDKLQIEIAYVTGFRPTFQAMADFNEFLREHTFKDDIEIIYTELPSPNEESLTLDEIDDLEQENRTAYNKDRTLAIYIYFADAPAEGDEESEGLVTLGAVYRNTSMVIHGLTIRRLVARSNFISDGDIEGATLNHEFGHLFGLVNLGTDPVNPSHEDTEAANHCNVQGCLMRAELQFGTSPTAKSKALLAKSSYEAGVPSGCILSGQMVMGLLHSTTGRSAIVPGLDSECILDLEGNGGR